MTILICCLSCNTNHSNTQFLGTLMVTSDADMIASAYVDGVLNKNFNIEDSLTVIRFNNNQIKKVQIHVSNSVMSWPVIATYSKKYKLAYIAESRGIHYIDSNSVTNVGKDMPMGGDLTVIDLSDKNKLKVVQTQKLGVSVYGVSINAKEDILAASVTTTEGKDLMLAKLENGKISSKYFIGDSLIKESYRLSSLYFHPKENILAINVDNTFVAFYKIIENNSKLDIRQIGAPLVVSTRWSEGKWFNNGEYFAVCDYAFTGLFPERVGSIKTIKFNRSNNHEIISSVKTGLSTEGFDLSPDNNYIVAVNMERSFLPNSYPDSLKKRASLTLIKANPQNGQLTPLGNNYEFEGALPEDAAFDLESNTIAVVIFNEIGELYPTQGKVDFWELENDSLSKLEFHLPLTRGPHTIQTLPN